MTPVQAAISSVGRAIISFHPLSMPRLARGHYRRELAAWACLALGLGAVEGGVTGVIAKNIFEGVVESKVLNMSVAVLAGAPAFANIVSFIWAGLSQGRHKIRFLVGLQVATMLFVGLIALAPHSGLGLMLLMLGAVGSRVCWSGVVTLRSTVWQANYPRHARAMMAGKIATVQTLLMALAGFGIAGIMEFQPQAFRVLYPLLGLAGLVGAWVFSGMRMRGHRALRNAETAGDAASGRSPINPMQLWGILRDDARFRRYMICMFTFGSGNLMVTAPLVIVLKDQFDLKLFPSTMIASTIPLLIIPLSIPLWSKLLDRVHIIEFRAYHSWSFVSSTGMVFIAAILDQPILLWVAAVLKGIAFGGGILGWNLGHHDFAPVEKANQYMGIHVTLTGIRGVFTPILAVFLYDLLELLSPGSGHWVFALCLALSLSGAVGFVLMRRSLVGPGHDSKFTDGPPVQPPATG